jgi:hypothetical protein
VDDKEFCGAGRSLKGDASISVRNKEVAAKAIAIAKYDDVVAVEVLRYRSLAVS